MIYILKKEMSSGCRVSTVNLGYATELEPLLKHILEIAAEFLKTVNNSDDIVFKVYNTKMKETTGISIKHEVVYEYRVPIFPKYLAEFMANFKDNHARA